MARTRDVINIIFSVSGVVIGLAASISFYIYGNSLAVFWAFFSACLALLTLHLHCLHQNGKLEEWHTEDTMNAIRALSVVMSITLTGVVVWFVFKIWYEHLPVYPIKDSVVISTVWIFMTAKWAFLLSITSRRYGNILRDSNAPLLAR